MTKAGLVTAGSASVLLSLSSCTSDSSASSYNRGDFDKAIFACSDIESPAFPESLELAGGWESDQHWRVDDHPPARGTDEEDWESLHRIKCNFSHEDSELVLRLHVWYYPSVESAARNYERSLKTDDPDEPGLRIYEEVDSDNPAWDGIAIREVTESESSSLFLNSNVLINLKIYYPGVYLDDLPEPILDIATDIATEAAHAI